MNVLLRVWSRSRSKGQRVDDKRNDHFPSTLSIFLLIFLMSGCVCAGVCGDDVFFRAWNWRCFTATPVQLTREKREGTQRTR